MSPLVPGHYEGDVRKAQAIADLLYEVCDGIIDETVAGLGHIDQAMREQVAHMAGVFLPSDTTWQIAVGKVLLRRRAVAELTAKIRESFAARVS